MTVTWTGGDPNGNVQILITGKTPTDFATASCIAPASAGTLTIPAYVLLALPSDNSGSFAFFSAQKYTALTATGLGVGSISTHITGARFTVVLK